jgi:predicted acyl esterase
MLMNPFDGPFWWDRASFHSLDKIKVPIYVIGKIAHEESGFGDLYTGVNAPKKLLVKPSGAEERPWREDLELLIRWYDHWLKGNDTGIMDEPPVKIFVQGANQYRNEKEWPLPNTDYTKCYLRRWESLSFAPELYQPEPDCFIQQPLFLSTKRDSVKYISPPLSGNLEVIGNAAFNFFASIDQDDTNWIVKLFDVAPTGKEARLSRGYLKASHRALDPQKSLPYTPYHPHTRESVQTIKPGEIYEYNVDLDVVSNLFTAGHRIKLEIESMESPRDPEMQIHYHPHLMSSKTTVHKIYRNKQYRSHLVLPITSGKQAVSEMMSDENFQGGV